MKLAVFGATGRTGQILLRKALEAGHSVQALAQAYSPDKGRVRCREVAFLGGLPSFIPKKMVKRGIVQGSATEPLFDWSGDGPKALGLANPDTLQVFIVDANGRLRFTLAGAFSEENLERVKDQVSSL